MALGHRLSVIDPRSSVFGPRPSVIGFRSSATFSSRNLIFVELDRNTSITGLQGPYDFAMFGKTFFLLMTYCWPLQAAIGQKLAFQNFSTDKGLLQTQAISITQDHQRHLWVGTLGGLNRFDGSHFMHFTKTEGLASSVIQSLYTAPNGYVWGGTLGGLVRYDGHRFVNYRLADSLGSEAITAIAADEDGMIWTYTKGKLFRLLNETLQAAPLPFAMAKASCLYRSNEGSLLVWFAQKGFFKWSNNQWAAVEQLTVPKTETVVYLHGVNHYLYVFSQKKIFLYSHGMLLCAADLPPGGFGTACTDDNGQLWLGNSKGLWSLNGLSLTPTGHYVAANGLSDNIIKKLYKDVEGNLWVGTDGDGLFKFSDGVFVRYDKGTGLPGNIVMGFAQHQTGDLLIALREGGLAQYNMATHAIKPTKLVLPNKATGVNCVAFDAQGMLWLGSLSGMLLRYGRNGPQEFLLDKAGYSAILSLLPDGDRMWVTTEKRCYYIKNDRVFEVSGFKGVATAILRLPNGERLLSSFKGLYQLNSDGSAQKIGPAALQQPELSCIAQWRHLLVLGTFADGVYCWNRESNKVYVCNKKNGLTDNQVFCVLVDSKERIWAATATGLQQVQLSESTGQFTVKRFSMADGYERCESNLHAITEDRLGRIWVGTTRGAYMFTNKENGPPKRGPYTVIQQVSVAGMPNPDPVPDSLVLPYSKNSISFTVKGIFMKDPESVRYAYQLVGYDQSFSQEMEQSFFNYQNLEPGQYIFRVRAATTEGIASENVAEYRFTVEAPFYKTRWFLLLMVLGLLLTGGLVQFFFMRTRQQRRRQRLRIRHEEQQAIRLRTSEDFHDELGNKLTRISLLTDILQQKMDQGDQEKNQLINQIRENVLALYAGTRDIIWSLSAGSDNLFETLQRIGQFGEELFSGSGITFVMSGVEKVDTGLMLPMGYSRNILMIFKESLHNSLKHSGASQVRVDVEVAADGQVMMTQTDDGRGFDETQVQKGNGLNNIRRRAGRINATLAISHQKTGGTAVSLSVKIPPKG
jgi:signal transduction histidine kinase/ligand-binding sensor domain-containing protein